MNETAALEMTENGVCGAVSDEWVEKQMVVNDSSPLVLRSTSPGTTHKPPVVHISRPQDSSGEDAGGDDSSSDSLTDDDDATATSRASNAVLITNVDGGGDHSEMLIPDEALQAKIVKQVEFYFSDANITKDAFLLKHIRRNKEGFVSLKLITSFKKIKSLTKDWRVVCYSLKTSTVLELNSERTKVKRTAPLPDYDESTSSRTVVAVNLPFENPSIENIAEMFKNCGEISLVRILRPGKPFPPDVRRHVEKHTEVKNKVCVLVEFESGQSALKAAKTMSDKDNWRSGMFVTVLAKERKKKTDGNTVGEVTNPTSDLTASDGAESGDACKKKRQRKKKNIRVDKLTAEKKIRPGTPSSSDVENSPMPNRRFGTQPVGVPQGRNSPSHLSPTNTPKGGSPVPSPHSSPRQQRKHKGRSPLANSQNSPEVTRKTYETLSDHSNTSSPWVQRRKLLAAAVSDGSPAGSPLMARRSMGHNESETVLRLPIGPDGSKGFLFGRGRGKPRANSSIN